MKLTTEQHEEMAQLHAEGVKISEIACRMGLHKSTVGDNLRKQGMTRYGSRDVPTNHDENCALIALYVACSAAFQNECIDLARN